MSNPVGRPAWSDALCGLVAERWQTGASASVIASEYGLTRGSVIGKMRRMGIVTPNTNKDRDAGGRRHGSKDSAPRQRAPRVDKPTPEESLFDDLSIPIDQRRSIYRLTKSCCHWPVGDPQEPGFFFCGASAVASRPYCRRHERMAHDYVRMPKLNPKYFSQL